MQFIGELYARGLLRTWLRDRPQGWELASGAWSPFYLMFREVPSLPPLFRYSVAALSDLVGRLRADLPVDILVGIATTGIPLAAGVALQTSLPMAFTRKLAGVRKLEDLDAAGQAWGQHALVEGRFTDGMRCLLVDDVVTGATSKQLARRQLEIEAARREVRVEFAGTVVVVDRGYPTLDAPALGVSAVHRMYDEVDQILHFGGSPREVEVIREYMEDADGFQNADRQAALVAEAC